MNLVFVLSVHRRLHVYADSSPQFGAGYGGCPGQSIAKIELAKIAATLVKDYKIKQVDPVQDWQWKAYFTVVPHSWPVYVEKRI